MTDLTLPADIARRLVEAPTYASDGLYDTYRWLRTNNPLGVAEAEGFDPFWVVTKHADILEISRNNALYPSAVRSTTLTSQSGEARARAITGTPHLVFGNAHPVRRIAAADQKCPSRRRTAVQ